MCGAEQATVISFVVKAHQQAILSLILTNKTLCKENVLETTVM